MTKRQFILDWAKKADDLTSYNMNPMVVKWCDTFYPDEIDERKAINNLTSYFRKLVKEGVLGQRKSVGAGPDAKNLFFGTTVQHFWAVNKDKLNQISSEEE